MTSKQRMESVRSTPIPANAIGLWFLGQNGFILKSPSGTTVAIDPYLTDSCRAKFSHLPLDLGRTLPILLEPEDLEADLFIVTHSHEDHLDEETVRRLTCQPTFIAPWEAMQRLQSFGLPKQQLLLLHPHETLSFKDLLIEGTFALPTDNTDLNHIGLLIQLENGIRFYNTGDTAYAEALKPLLPTAVDICAICINGGFHNLSHGDAAKLIHAIAPKVAIPTHYDMMHCNQSDPEMFRNALFTQGVSAQYRCMDYDHPFLYIREQP